MKTQNTDYRKQRALDGNNKLGNEMRKEVISDLDYDAAMSLEDYVFMEKNTLRLAVTCKYLCADAQLTKGLIGNKHFSLINLPPLGCGDGPRFVKAGGYERDGSFSWFYLISWQGRSVISRDIKLDGGAIIFLSPKVKLCSTYRDMSSSTAEAQSVRLTLGVDAIENIRMSSEHWDELFSWNSGTSRFKGRLKKKSLGFEKVASGVWGRNHSDIGGMDEIIDASFHWQYPVKFHRKVWWTIG